MSRIVFLLFLSLLIGILSASAQPRKVIIDTDPGVEDAMELVGAMQYPGIEILGITTISSRSTKNALRVVELLGKNIPVFQGASRALFGPSLREGPDFVNGDDGLGNTNQPEPKIKAHRSLLPSSLWKWRKRILVK